ncbi:tRNA adenosine(34) deaminase TadA [Desulfoprunum benzoelyticum]|uniref:tRNA-specific adenosine deaminase n=1 Tax=Desulfoprunum benzoelyticum TaxID=1506996 RepID=A0A840UZZ5_9BACT|nr:tRNA adenosine(34) deaminase TadA [Desulfoprunum benzoelyticum]MBB5349014.1 tRNA(adenine34) deaminase [Desulfoprunum benzoelyticum]MBM9530507.1 tRNA adenosine(34) deaminase TadA [Desulfoprunum benzoelyticum]
MTPPSTVDSRRASGPSSPQPPGDEQWMRLALEQARSAAERGEVPVGAVITAGDQLIAAAGNGPISLCDPTAHAEILALRRAAARIGNYRLAGTTLYVTLEPCLMCMGAMIHARVTRLVFGAFDPKTGAALSCYRVASDGRLNHRLEITAGILEAECSALLRDFFRHRRDCGQSA